MRAYNLCLAGNAIDNQNDQILSPQTLQSCIDFEAAYDCPLWISPGAPQKKKRNEIHKRPLREEIERYRKTSQEDVTSDTKIVTFSIHENDSELF